MKNLLSLIRRIADTRTDEQLSAYLDGALSPRERARLEARLARDPRLRARLEALRRTVSLVRAMPPARAPRNFLLTPAMVAEPRPAPARVAARRLRPVALTFATALSGLACALLLLGNLFSAGLGGPQAAVPAPMGAYELPAPTALKTVPGGEATETAPAEALRSAGLLSETPSPEAAGALQTPPPAPRGWEETPHPLESEPVGGMGGGGGWAPGGVDGFPPPPSEEGKEEGGALFQVETVTPEQALRAALPEEATVTPEPMPGPSPPPVPLARPGGLERPPLLSWLPVVGMALLTAALAVLTVRSWRVR